MQSDGRLNRLFRRIDNFLAAPRLALRKAFGGSATAEDIFRVIERGEVGRRPRTGAAQGARRRNRLPRFRPKRPSTRCCLSVYETIAPAK
jgi:hypothetical protein